MEDALVDGFLWPALLIISLIYFVAETISYPIIKFLKKRETKRIFNNVKSKDK